MWHKVLPLGPLKTNCLILADETTREAWVIDPAFAASTILQELKNADLHLTTLLHTHAHIDHVGASGTLAQQTGAKTYLHPADYPLYALLEVQAQLLGLPTPEKLAKFDQELADQQILKLGNHTLQVLHTPGHSPGSVCFYLSTLDLCIVGDTLFAGGVGRTDLWGGDSAALSQSIKQKLYSLPELTKIIPGHGPTSTIGQEKMHNPFVSDYL